MSFSSIGKIKPMVKRPQGVEINPALPKPFFFGTPHTSVEKRQYGPGEYFNVFVDRTTGRAYEYMGVPVLLSPLHIWKVAGGAHNYMLLDSFGVIYVGGNDNTYGQKGNGTITGAGSFSPVALTTDSLGNALPAFVDIMCGGTSGWLCAARTAAGDAYAWGSLNFGVRANGTEGGNCSRPVKLPLPVAMKQVIINELCIGLAFNGDVYTWGASQTGGGSWTPFILAQGSGTTYHPYTPTKITLPAPAVMIAGGGEMMNYAVLNTGRLSYWGYDMEYGGIRGKGLNNYGYSPADVTDSLNITPGTIDTIAVSSAATYMILNDSTGWGWGSNACSNLGFRGLNYADPSLYWVFSQNFNPAQAPVWKPIRLAPGIHNITSIFVSLAFCYAVGLNIHAADGNDSVIWCGRNKYAVTDPFRAEVDSFIGDQGSHRPNNFDLDTGFVYVDPWRASHITRATERYCALFPSDADCIANPLDNSKARPTSIVGGAQTVPLGSTPTVYSHTTVASGVSGVMRTSWRMISWPSGIGKPIFHLNTSDTTKVYGMTKQGTYVCEKWTEDSNYKVDSATMTITITSPSTPPANYLIKPRGHKRIWAAIKPKYIKPTI